MLDGICQNESKYGYQANTPECLFDGGDCNKNNEMYPKCISRYRYFGNIANGVCELFIDAHNEDCGWDGGDCEGTSLCFYTFENFYYLYHI